MKTITPATKLLFKYLALPKGLAGRGGVQRFFLLSQGIPFTEELYAKGEEWAIEKARLFSTGENPCAQVPVIEIDEGDQHLLQHIATCRFLAHVHGTASGDPYQDYVQDLVSDEYQGFRNTWATMSFSASDEERATYRVEGLPKQLQKFDALYGQFKTHDVFLSVSPKTQNPLWGDAAIFGLLRDHAILGHMSVDDLDAYPYLKALYEAYGQIPAISEWIVTKEKALMAATT
jgi:glutathione S-transferase